VALVIAHKFVPAGRRSFLSVLPGVGVTLVLWLLGGIGFGWYPTRISFGACAPDVPATSSTNAAAATAQCRRLDMLDLPVRSARTLRSAIPG